MARTKKATTAPTAAATFTKPVPVTPAQRKGSSTIENPVGHTWVACLNLTAKNGHQLAARKDYHRAAIALGVAYYTARTQVNRYLQWAHAGSEPTNMPRGVALPPKYTAPTNC